MLLRRFQKIIHVVMFEARVRLHLVTVPHPGVFFAAKGIFISDSVMSRSIQFVL